MMLQDINPRLAVITTDEVMSGTSPIASITIDEDGDLQFLGLSGAQEESARVVSLEQILSIDPSLRWLSYSSNNIRFERSNQGWTQVNR